MLNFLDKKTKLTLGLIGFAGISILSSKFLLDANNYKMLKNINRKLCKNSWEYYD